MNGYGADGEVAVITGGAVRKSTRSRLTVSARNRADVAGRQGRARAGASRGRPSQSTERPR